MNGFKGGWIENHSSNNWLEIEIRECKIKIKTSIIGVMFIANSEAAIAKCISPTDLPTLYPMESFEGHETYFGSVWIY